MSTQLDPDLQLRLWGAIWTGDYERTATLAENHHRDGRVWTLDMWDCTHRSLAYQEIRTPDGGSHSVPEWWALPWVSEHLARHGEVDVFVTASVPSRSTGETGA